MIEKLPEAVGVPEITPDEAIVKPAGRAPEVMDQEYGEVPPAARSETEYAALTVPFARDEVATESGCPAPLTVKEKACVVTFWMEPESVTFMVTEKLPEAVGVPVIAPVDAARVTPEGRAPEAMDQE